MLGKLILVCLVVSAAALDVATTRRMGQKWETWEAKSVTDKVRRHQGYVKEAMDQLKKLESPKAVDRVFDAKRLDNGVVWTDMPCDEDYPDYLNAAMWSADYKKAKKPNIVQAVHYGCAMHWHGSQSEFDPRTIDGQKIDRVYFTNANVKKQVYAQARYWWNKAVSEAKQKKDKKFASFHLGHVAHVLMNAQSADHVVRGWKIGVKPNPPVFTEWTDVRSCPPVVYYTGYVATKVQPKAAAAAAAKPHQILDHCARAYTYQLFKAFFECIQKGAACGFEDALKPLLDHEFAWADATFSGKVTAGRPDHLMGKEAKASGQFKIDPAFKWIDIDGKKQNNLWFPVVNTEDKGKISWDAMAKSPNANLRNAGMCVSLQVRTGFSRVATKPWVDYENVTPATTGVIDEDPVQRTRQDVAISEVTVRTL